MTTHKAKKIEAGRYEYRGIKVRRNYDIPSGYWGAWTTGLRAMGAFRANAGTLTDIKTDIDQHLDKGAK